MKLLSRIYRTLYWLPVIWQDVDWDPRYLYRILRHKLYTIERHWSDPGYIGAEHDAKRIMIARVLCDRLIADDYLMDAIRWPMSR